MPYGFIMRRKKIFAGNFSACIISNTEYLFDKSKLTCVVRNIRLKL